MHRAIAVDDDGITPPTLPLPTLLPLRIVGRGGCEDFNAANAAADEQFLTTANRKSDSRIKLNEVDDATIYWFWIGSIGSYWDNS